MFPLTLIGECRKAIRRSEEMVRDWLRTGMFKNDIQNKGPQEIKHTISIIIKEFGDHALTKSHARHIPMEKCKDMGQK